MDGYLDRYRRIRIERCRDALEMNGFEVHLADDPSHARKIVIEEIVPRTGARTVSWGDSLTLQATGVLDIIRNDPNFDFVETFDSAVPWKEVIERRKRALLADLFFTGTNAVTETGMLVNLDMVGNRVAGITFGPKHVVIVVGRNKIVPGLDEAMMRIKKYAAPINAMRHPGFKTPCVKTARCVDCSNPRRICNTWMIIEKCYPKGRIKVILIDEELGL